MKRPPIVLIPACNVLRNGHPFHIAGRKYADAVRLAGCLPLVVPSALSDELPALLTMADGLLLTGSPSNVHPRHFSADIADPTLPLDLERDGWTLDAVPLALELGVPLFGICRGFQEAIVALGGSLHQAVHALPGHRDHREPPGLPPEEAYAPSHGVVLTRGGVLDGLLSAVAVDGAVQVNSLHGQGADRLPPGARVEARAEDGLVEAFSVPGTPAFNLCVQWHPEWLAAQNPVSQRLFAAFGNACAARANARQATLADGFARHAVAELGHARHTGSEPVR